MSAKASHGQGQAAVSAYPPGSDPAADPTTVAGSALARARLE
jgi:hypothetical protein